VPGLGMISITERSVSVGCVFVLNMDPAVLGPPSSWCIRLTLTRPQLLRIVYGSQTGTANMFAHLLAEAAQQQRWRVQVSACDEDIPALDAPLLVLVTSVFGEGEPPENARVSESVRCLVRVAVRTNPALPPLSSAV
jgi:sulfite reductase alpha subunit-like flavoprotein